MVGDKKPSQDSPIVQSMQLKIASAIVTLPRITRILIVGVFALTTALAVSPIIDDIYLDNYFSEDTRWLPAMVTTAIGLFVYMVGWRIIVGTVGESAEPTKQVVWYLVVGFIAIVMVALWLFRLLSM